MIVITNSDDADCTGNIDTGNRVVGQSFDKQIFSFAAYKFQSSKTITAIIVFS